MSLIARVKARAQALMIKAISEERSMAVQLDITNACNLSCTHCYHPHHSNKGSIRLVDWMRFLTEIQSFMGKYRFRPYFIICGGEPLLSPFLKPIVEKIAEIWSRPQIVILTNGTVHREETFAFLAKHSAAYQVSLDGPDALRHDSVRGVGSFAKSIEGIRKIKATGAELSILSILSARTKPWIPEFFNLAKEIGADSQNFTRLIAQGNGRKLVDDQADSPLFKLDLKQAMESIVIYSALSDVATNTNQPLYALVDSRLGQSGFFAYDALVIDYKGNLKATSRADLVLGNLLDSSIEELFISNPIMQIVRDKRIEVCGSCDLYDRCGGDRNAAYAYHGHFTASDPGCWK